MIKNYFEHGFDFVSYCIAIVLGSIIMMTMTGTHSFLNVIGFIILSSIVTISLDMLSYRYLERGDLIE